jgi:solute carrier family 35, member E1
MNAFPKPVTLTLIQFASVSIWCLISAYLASISPAMRRAVPALKNGLRYPSMEVISTALPLSVFSLLGHLLSSYATSKIPVSLVHTIKGLSPLFTVLAYRLVFRIRYAKATYLSLIPLTVGVMMACSGDFGTNLLGILASFSAAVVFVTQNIFSKRLFTEASRAEADGQLHNSRKLDKLNLLCYCSVGALLFTAPVWLFTEGFPLLQDLWKDGAIDLSLKKGAMDHGALAMEFIFNGIFHFAQNILAFVLLSMLSPVSYSVASLVKRVWVIITAIFWFHQPTTKIQAFGVGLTFLGLYLYDRTSTEDAAERRTKTDHFRHKAALLPLAEVADVPESNGHVIPPEHNFPGTYFKKDAGGIPGQNDNSFSISWMPAGTKQGSMWAPGDIGIDRQHLA